MARRLSTAHLVMTRCVWLLVLVIGLHVFGTAGDLLPINHDTVSSCVLMRACSDGHKNMMRLKVYTV